MIRAIGLDFGTTHSAVSVVDGPGLSARLARFSVKDGGPFGGPAAGDVRELETFRSILFFDPAVVDARGRAVALAGPCGIARYLERIGPGRLIQSIKSHLASPLLDKTVIHGRTFRIEELVSALIVRIREAAERDVGDLGRRIVCGRPVNFAQADTEEDNQRAVERLTTALSDAGFDDVRFVFEPLGAAFEYASRLDHDELVLIADFGGGTSDFCVMRVGPQTLQSGGRASDVLGQPLKQGRRSESLSSHPGERSNPVLATSGLARAGDELDASIVQAFVSPALGFGSRYRLPFGTETMEIPPWIYNKLRRWHHLSLLRAPDTMRLLGELRKQALEPDRVEALIHLVKEDLGFELYRAVESSKVSVCSTGVARLLFEHDPIEIDTTFVARDFETLVEEQVRQIDETAKSALDRAGVSERDVDRVFLTGGTSLVPAVVAAFRKRFGQEKLAGGRALTSVALGLSRVALT